MFELNVGSTPCTLNQRDYRLLGQKSDGYSGSDIAVVVRDALMQPVRKVLSATHFKKVPRSTLLCVPSAGRLTLYSRAQVLVPSPADPKQTVTKLTPCSPGDAAAEEKSWTDVDGDELLEPPLMMNDFLQALATTPPTVRAEDVKRHLEFTNEAGADGG